MSQTYNDALKARIKQQLETMLTEMQATAPLPEPSSDEAQALGDKWNAQFKAIEQKEFVAMHVAIMLLPADVRPLVEAILHTGHERIMGRKDTGK